MENTSNTNQVHHLAKLHYARPTIGMLLESMPDEEEDYLSAVLAGVISAAEERDVNLLCFAGGHLYRARYTQFDTQRNILYEMATCHNVSGLIILGPISTYASAHKAAEFYHRYDPLPIVKIGQLLEDIPTVFGDEETGIYAAMAHLIQDHHYRHIAFVDCPENLPYPRPRYRTYAKALADYGIALDPALVVPGDWSIRSGREAVSILLDQRQARFEAIVTANDSMALGVLEALQARGIHVPYEVALIGFDDIKKARLVVPSLTTVRQPMFEFGAQAVDMLLAQIAGEKVPQQMLLPTELVIRQSCGCPDPIVTRTAAWATARAVKPSANVSTAQREQIVADLAHTVGSTADAAGWAEQLLDAISADLQDQSAGTFLPTLDKILRRAIQRGDDVTLWQDMISALRLYVQPYLGNTDLSSRTEDLWHQARAFVGEAARKELAQRQMQMDQQNISLRTFGQAIVTTFEVEALLNLVIEGMARLGIPGCYLALYENPQPYEYPQPAPEWSHLILAYHETDAQHPAKYDKSKSGERRFRSTLLMPPGILPQNRRYTMVIEPLYFQKEQIGFVLLEMGPTEGPIYEVLREQISSTLKGTLLFQAQRRTEEALEKAYAEVEKQVQERTSALEQEIIERKQAENKQKSLIAELEAKNAELERFAYTVSHDLKSPLITIGGFVGFLEKDALAGNAERVKADVAYINDATAKMQRLLNELLELSRIGRLMNSPEEASFADIAREAVASVHGHIAARGVEVEIAPGLPTVYSERARLVEVVQNLVDNAVKFMGDQPQPRVEIGMRQDGDEPVFYVRDNGMGIEPQYHDKIFGLFDKLDPDSEGTGIGLALVKRIVETHGGKIWVESEGKGQGSTFCFTLQSS